MNDDELTDPIATLAEAASRAEVIRQGMVSYAETLTAIGVAYRRRDWVALKYNNWDAYVAGEFGEQKLRITGEQRAEAITALRMDGLSTRAIASALGVSKGTINNDLKELPNSGQFEERVQGLDGKSRPAAMPARERVTPPNRDEPAEDQSSHLDEQPLQPTLDPVGEPHPDHTEPDRDPSVEERAESPDIDSRRGAPPTGKMPGSADPGAPIVVPDAIPSPAPGTTVDHHDRPPRTDAPDTEEVEARRRRCEGLSDALIFLWSALDPDPVRALTWFWDPALAKHRDLPRVGSVYTAEGIRSIADHLYAIAEHLEETGATL